MEIISNVQEKETLQIVVETSCKRPEVFFRLFKWQFDKI